MLSQPKSAVDAKGAAMQGNSFADLLKLAQGKASKAIDQAAAKQVPMVSGSEDRSAVALTAPADTDSNSTDASVVSAPGTTSASEEFTPDTSSASGDSASASLVNASTKSAVDPKASIVQQAAAGGVGAKIPARAVPAENKSKAPPNHKGSDVTASVVSQSASAHLVALQNPPVAQSVVLQNPAGETPQGESQNKPAAFKLNSVKSGTKAVTETNGFQLAANNAVPDVAKSAASTVPSVNDNKLQDADVDDHGSFFGDKIAAPVGLPIAQIAVPATTTAPAAASVHFSLQDLAKPSNAVTSAVVDFAVQASASVSDGNAATQVMPAVRHLDVAVSDPVLGTIGIRAEMRAGALHASISGAGDIAAAAPQLHQYLQQHDVALHSISFTSAAGNDTRPQVTAAATTSFGGSMDSSSNQSGAQQQGNARAAAPEWTSDSAGYTDDNSNVFSSSAMPAAVFNASGGGSTLSIHI